MVTKLVATGLLLVSFYMVFIPLPELLEGYGDKLKILFYTMTMANIWVMFIGITIGNAYNK